MFNNRVVAPALQSTLKLHQDFWRGYSRAFLRSGITYDACDVNRYYIMIIQSPSTAGRAQPRHREHPPIRIHSASSKNNTALSAFSWQKRTRKLNKGCDLERTTARSCPRSTGLMISPSSCLSMLFGSMTRQENTTGNVEFALPSTTAIKKCGLAAVRIDDSVVTL